MEVLALVSEAKSLELPDFAGFAKNLFQQFTQPNRLCLDSNVCLLLFRAAP